MHLLQVLNATILNLKVQFLKFAGIKGNKAIAPPNNTAKMSKDIAPSITGLLLMKDIPPKIEFMVIDSEFYGFFLVEMKEIIILVASGNISAIEYATSGFNT